MSEIDYSDDRVMKNWLKSQMQEGKGDFSERKEVLIFTAESGVEFLVPTEWEEELGLGTEQEQSEEEELKTLIGEADKALRQTEDLDEEDELDESEDEE